LQLQEDHANFQRSERAAVDYFRELVDQTRLLVPSTATNPEAYAEANSMLASFPLRTRKLAQTAINYFQPKLESNLKGRDLL
jgi:hypothetical protein